MKETLKTLLEGIKFYTDSRIDPLCLTEEQALELVAEMGLVDPITNNGYVLTDENGVVYTI